MNKKNTNLFCLLSTFTKIEGELTPSLKKCEKALPVFAITNFANTWSTPGNHFHSSPLSFRPPFRHRGFFLWTKQYRNENAWHQIADYFSVTISLKSQTKTGLLCNLTVDFSILGDYGFCSYFSYLAWCELSKHYECNTIRVRKFPIIVSFFIDKALRDMPISKVTALYCFISILSHTTDLLKTSTNYFPCFGFSLCCHSFHCNGYFLDTKLYSCPSHKKTS